MANHPFPHPESLHPAWVLLGLHPAWALRASVGSLEATSVGSLVWGFEIGLLSRVTVTTYESSGLMLESRCLVCCFGFEPNKVQNHKTIEHFSKQNVPRE